MADVKPYGAAIREAIASNSLKKMKTAAKIAKQTISDQKDLHSAYIDLVDAITKLEKK
jgi:hypothetical protein